MWPRVLGMVNAGILFVKCHRLPRRHWRSLVFGNIVPAPRPLTKRSYSHVVLCCITAVLVHLFHRWTLAIQPEVNGVSAALLIIVSLHIARFCTNEFVSHTRIGALPHSQRTHWGQIVQVATTAYRMGWMSPVLRSMICFCAWSGILSLITRMNEKTKYQAILLWTPTASVATILFVFAIVSAMYIVRLVNASEEGRCIRCGYIMNPQLVCPECGFKYRNL